MELTGQRGGPFIYVPLRHHFRAELPRQATASTGTGAGRCLDYDQTGPRGAGARPIAAEIGRPVSYRPRREPTAPPRAGLPLLSELI